MLKKTFRNA